MIFMLARFVIAHTHQLSVPRKCFLWVACVAALHWPVDHLCNAHGLGIYHSAANLQLEEKVTITLLILPHFNNAHTHSHLVLCSQ